MGIEDRAYYRDRPTHAGEGATVGGRPRGMGSMGAWSVNTWLIVINTAVFVLGLFLVNAGVPVQIGQRWLVNPADVQDPATVDWPEGSAPSRVRPQPVTKPIVDRATGQQVGIAIYRIMDPLEAIGHFSTAKFFRLEVWRLITFQFLHAGFWHIALNMFGLFIFGGMVEQFLGGKRYLAFYLMCGIAGGLTYLLLNLLGGIAGLQLPGVLFNDIRTPLVGASAGVFGIIMAAAFIAPNTMIMLIFPPIPMPLKFFAYGYVGLAVLNLFMGGHNAGGDAAHVGGALAGAFFIRRSHLLRDFFDVFGDSRKSPRARRRGSGPGRGSDRPSQGDIDRILEKVSQRGLGSLSASERETLRRASESQRLP